MPIYEYVCSCGREAEERIVSCLSAVDDQRCKFCGLRMTRRPSAASFKIEGFSAKNNYSYNGKLTLKERK